MNKLFLVIGLGFSVCASSWGARLPDARIGQTLSDGHSVMVAGSQSDCAINQCVRVERSGKMVYTYAIAHGQIKSVEAVELPFEAVVGRAIVVPSGARTEGAGGEGPQPPPSPPPGGTGSVTITQTYTTATEVVTIVTVFTYVNGSLIGINTVEFTAPKHKQIQ